MTAFELEVLTAQWMNQKEQEKKEQERENLKHGR